MKLVSLERTPTGCIVIFEHCGIFSRQEISAKPDSQYRAYKLALAVRQARIELGADDLDTIDPRIVEWVHHAD